MSLTWKLLGVLSLCTAAAAIAAGQIVGLYAYLLLSSLDECHKRGNGRPNEHPYDQPNERGLL